MPFMRCCTYWWLQEEKARRTQEMPRRPCLIYDAAEGEFHVAVLLVPLKPPIAYIIQNQPWKRTGEKQHYFTTGYVERWKNTSRMSVQTNNGETDV